MELRTKARRLQAEAGLDLVIVDYLQLMQATTSNRDANRVQEVSEISRGLKALARELSVPVIALSQLSRQPEMRESKEPRLSDLRESGAIEQDADLVMFLWREKERGQDDQAQDGEVVNLKLAKHRNGPTGEIQLWFKKTQTQVRLLRGRSVRRNGLIEAGRSRADDPNRAKQGLSKGLTARVSSRAMSSGPRARVRPGAHPFKRAPVADPPPLGAADQPSTRASAGGSGEGVPGP